jgi:hypothetical protein
MSSIFLSEVRAVLSSIPDAAYYMMEDEKKIFTEPH